MENAEINSASTREMTNNRAISAPEEEETGTKLVEDNQKSDDVEVISSIAEKESIDATDERSNSRGH